jgi:Mg2+ and Co2+ transporter CorA
VPVQELGGLLRQPDALVWVDIPRCDGKTAMVLSETFGFHDIAIRDCLERNHISKLHVYDDHVFTVLHAPEIGSHGHVHYVELDQFLGPNYLVTVHGPLNPAVDPAVASLDTEQVRKRIENGRLHPKTPFELSSAIVSALTRREINLIADLAKQSGDLERKLMLGQVSTDPEPFLEELFRAWYELLAIRTIAVHSAATYDRMAKLVRSLPPAEQPLVADIADRFHQVASMADGQREFLHGVIEFFQTRTSTPHDHRRRTPERNLRAAERRHAPDHRLGRDRRRTHRGDRVLRAERPLPRVRRELRVHRLHRDHADHRGHPVPRLQTQELALIMVTGRCEAPASTPGRHLNGDTRVQN